MGKSAGSVSIIGGADGPTSIFIAGKGGTVKLTRRIQNYFCKIKRNRIKKRITANPHTLEEVVELLKREYGAVEVSQHEYSCAAEPPVQYRLSHLSRRSEPLINHTICYDASLLA